MSHHQKLVPSLHVRSATVVLLAIGIPVCLLAALRHQAVSVEQTATTLPADGRFHQIALIHDRWRLPLDPGALHIAGSATELRPVNRSQIAVLVRTPVQPGLLSIALAVPARPKVLGIRLTLDLADTFEDGTPDFLRLHSGPDQAAFRRWFTMLAERAADMTDVQLAREAPEIVDCASLLRYSYREALRAHNDRWYAGQSSTRDGPTVPTLPSVTQWTYPETPLSTGLFRIRPGPFAASDLPSFEGSGAFAQFADAKTLYSLNAFRLSRDLHAARPGDLIFYRLLERNSQYHSMIVTGVRGEWVVYHTGPIGKQRGEMRRMLLADLLHHPDPRWRPERSNPNFLGVYRWNILREP